MSRTRIAAIPKKVSLQDKPSAVQPVPFSTEFLLTVALLIDIVAAWAGLSLGFWIRFRSEWISFAVVEPGPRDYGSYHSLILVGVSFLIATFGYLQLYDARHLLQFRRSALIILKGSTFWLFAYLSISLVLKFVPPISRIYVAASYVCCLGTLLLWRWLFDRFLHLKRVAETLHQRVVFLGWNDEAGRVASAIHTDPTQPYKVIGCVVPRSYAHAKPPESVPVLGQISDLETVFECSRADILLVADLDPEMEKLVKLANLCQRHFVQFKVIPSYFQILISGLQLEIVSGVPILGISELPLDRPLNRFVKRLVDIAGSVSGLIISTPLMIVFAVLSFLESPGPVVFAQERIGRNGRRFNMYKLRSMRAGSEAEDDANQSTLRDDPRITRVGKIMRKWNIDEIPQFWNVLRGDMCLVGPRPERTYHSTKLSTEIPHYNARYASKPGMTGWAQINGLRGDTDLIARVRYDLFYLENWSLWLDFQIMILTFFRKENAY